ncbi:MAG: glucoamylase [Legionellales bacterium RIFCSPHIGHO2_12_FULL_42_9]|nr:MAG: glucoamylase [Legionellales bacterium RIFCSPHIGHO2_12_FULL_42_9]
MTHANAAAFKSAPPVFNTEEIATLKQNFLANFTEKGAILASPSNVSPNYYYDWIRDSAIAMDLIADWYEAYGQHEDKIRLLNYVSWTQKIQQQTDPNPGQDIIGEPKFNLDSTPYIGAWGRPQNDGPALRALTLIHFANVLLNNREVTYVHSHLYAGGLDPHTMGAIKVDLEYIAHHWREKNYDLWEEVYGHHFFTEMVQRKALLAGAKLARLRHEAGAADYYEKQAQLITTHLNEYIDPENGLIRATLIPHPGPQKNLELDSAVILGVLLGNANDTVFAANNDYIHNTFIALKKQFKTLFPINGSNQKTILFGRYPGDTYDGYRSDSLGNPWFILTATMAEYNYTKATLLPHTPENTEQIEDYRTRGDDYLRLIKHYAPNLTMKEQINLNHGEQQGAESLTWSYVAVLRAIEARQRRSA